MLFDAEPRSRTLVLFPLGPQRGEVKRFPPQFPERFGFSSTVYRPSAGRRFISSTIAATSTFFRRSSPRYPEMHTD